MDFVHVIKQESIATVVIERGKVNALDNTVVDQLRDAFKELERDPSTRAVIFTGRGKFFSFGFDIPQFIPWPKEDFFAYLVNFTNLYTYLFLYPKPLIAALNGHAIAGGCMLALACDHRLMVTGKAKISLNEIGFGSSVFAGSTEMLRFWTGSANATQILCSGAMYPAEQALELGLVDQVTTEADLPATAVTVASELGAKDPSAFASIKGLLRQPVAEAMTRRETDSIREFVDIWYSETTRANLHGITIR
ncbi:MAG: enoyl-CoA hydratase/isomerase family protein [Thermodesulfobacteriota bacterium]